MQQECINAQARSKPSYTRQAIQVVHLGMEVDGNREKPLVQVRNAVVRTAAPCIAR